MPTSTRWAIANLPKIFKKDVHPAGGQSRPPLQSVRAVKFFVGADDSVGPKKCCEFAEDSRKNGAICTGRCGHRPLQSAAQIFGC